MVSSSSHLVYVDDLLLLLHVEGLLIGCDELSVASAYWVAVVDLLVRVGVDEVVVHRHFVPLEEGDGRMQLLHGYHFYVQVKALYLFVGL